MTVSEKLRARTKPSAWVLEKEYSCIAPDDVWSNKDMDPSPLEYRTWTSWTFFAYWACDLINPGSYATVSSFVAIGLAWWEAILALLVGSILCAIVITANGVIGATTHTPFAVTTRATFGYWGSKFVVFSRMCIALFWMSINSWSGGQFVSLMIISIWPSYRNLQNSVPAGQGATSSDFLSFFIFWVLQLPFIYIHPSKLAWLFNTKAVLMPITVIGMMIWALIKIRDVGGNTGDALNQLSNRAAPGAARFFAFMTAVTGTMGTWSTLSLNIGDFSRYCKKPSAAYIQLFAFPIIFTSLSIFAAITAACCFVVYGDALYQPYDVMAKWDTSAGGRAAMFLGSLIMCFANITTNITANSISAANDMTTLAPKWLNIKRGQFLAATIGVWGFVPWKVLNNASNFLTFMASYSIVLAPIAAMMAVDFFLIKKRKYNIYEMYKPNGIYRYSGGWNWRAYIALGVAVAINLPGMIAAINSTVDIGGLRWVYMASNITGDFFALIIYIPLCYFFPAPESIIDEAVHDVYDFGAGAVAADPNHGVAGKEKGDEVYTGVTRA